LAVVPIEALVYMKLKARRRRDMVDVVELVKAGTDAKRVRGYLARHDQDLLPAFDELVNEDLNATD
jgi:hypothetical protein